MRVTSVLSVIGCCLSLAAASVQPGFDPKDVVRRVHSDAQVPHDRVPSIASLDGEFLVDTSTTYVPAPDDQITPAVAFDGVNFLVVWEDSRNGPWQVYGARVTPQGTLVDPAGFLVSQTGDQFAPAVAFGGTEFLVVWGDYIDQGTDVYGARVTPQGTVLDSTPLVVSRAANEECSPAVGFDGANFLVAWQNLGHPDADIYGARVTPEGIVLDTAGFVVSQTTATYGVGYPAIGCDGANSLVVWQDGSSGYADIHGARVTPQGTVLDTADIVIARATYDQYSPALAFDGANFLVAWNDNLGGDSVDISGVRVSPEGTVLDSTPFVISHASNGIAPPALAFDGTNFFIAWSDHSPADSDGTVYGARVTPQGSVIDSAGIVVSYALSSRYYPVAALGDSVIFVAWEDARSGRDETYGARVTPAGAVLDSAGIIVSRAANDQQAPAIASDGTNFLVAWQDYRDGSGYGDIFAARVTQEGGVLDPAGFVVSHATNEQMYPALAFDGTNYLVVWVDVRDGRDWDIFGARVTQQGQVLDPEGIDISRNGSGQNHPAVAFDGTGFLVVWYDWRDEGTWAPHIYGARVASSGVVLDTAGIRVSQLLAEQYRPEVASDGTNSLVVWTDWRSGDGRVYGARVTSQGHVLDTAGFDISRAPSGASSPALCFDGTNYLVLWDDSRTMVQTDIYGARVSSQGAMLDSASFAITQSLGGRLSPSVSFDGTNSLVVWRDVRSGEDPEIRGARVTPEARVFGGGSVVSNQGNPLSPRVCCGNSGKMLLVYQDWAGTLGGKTYNAERVWGLMDPNPGVAEKMIGERSAVNVQTTIIRGVLNLQPAIYSLQSEIVLLSVDGRKVMDLRPGANDVRALAPGVYFVREQGPRGRGFQDSSVTKVVITR